MEKRRPGRRPAAARDLPPAPAGALEEAFRELDRARGPLFLELEGLLRDPHYLRGEPAHLSCTRERNQMRISPLEAMAMAEALRSRPELRKHLPSIRRRLRKELERLEDTARRQNFRCPLLAGTRCLVHEAAKPIGCLAWNPGRKFSDLAWFAFARRDELNDALFGKRWKLRAIPLWLSRALRGSTSRGRRVAGPRGGSGRASSDSARSSTSICRRRSG